MGKISNYARVLKAKLQDVFVCDQTDNDVTTTKSVTVEQIGDAICGEQVHSDLKTDNQTIIGSINELAKDKNVADEYDDTHTYNTGDVTIYDNTLYICNTNNSTGTFDPSKWTATTIDNIIGDLSQLTTTDKSSLVGAVNEVNTSISNNGFTTFTNGAYKRMTNGCVMLYLNGATHQQDLPIPLPDKSYYFTGLNQSNAVCGFFINTSGKLSIINSSTNTAVYATVVYST